MAFAICRAQGQRNHQVRPSNTLTECTLRDAFPRQLRETPPEYPPTVRSFEATSDDGATVAGGCSCCRESAERAMQEATGGELRTFTVGNPPAAFHPL